MPTKVSSRQRRDADDIAARAIALVTRYCHDEALEIITRVLEVSQRAPSNKLSLARARALIGLERHRLAEEALQAIASDESAEPIERAEAKQLLARIFVRLWADLDLAIDLARQAAIAAGRAGDAGREVVIYARGDAAIAYARKRAKRTAEAELAIVREIAPNDPRLLAFEAAVELEFDERAKARDIYEKCASLGPEGRRFNHLGLARIARLMGDFAAGHAELDALGDTGKCDLAPRYERNRLLVSERNWPAAVASYDELLAASPRSDNARLLRGERAVALYHAGRREECVATWEALAAEPIDDRVAQAARRSLRLLKDPERRSAKHVRLREFPSVAQLRDHCGPASCELYLKYFGITADQIEIARQIKLPGGGTPVYAMRRFLEGAGLEVRRIEADLETLKKVLDLGLPLILEEEYSTTRHVAVAIGYDDERDLLEVQDPMTHEIRETPYEALPRLLALANHGALIGVPKNDAERLAMLDRAGIREAGYIALVDDAWRALDDGKLEDANKLCDEAIALRRDYELAWICKFQIARRECEADAHPSKKASLSRILGEILTLWPDDEWPQQYIGYDLFNLGRYEESLRAFEKARDRDDADGNNWSMIADCLISLGRSDEAVQPLYEALRRLPWHVRATENLADLLERRGDIGRAWALNDAARELGDGNPFNHEVQARLFERKKQLEKALAAYERAIECDANRTYAHFRRARTLAALGRIDDALGGLQPMLDKAPKEQGMRIEIADMLYEHGQAERAIAFCDAVLALDKEAPSAIAIKGASLTALGKAEEGTELLRNALRLRPQYAWAYAQLGKHLHKSGKHAEALAAAAAAHGLQRRADHAFLLATVLSELGAAREAAMHVRDAVEDLSAIDGERLKKAAEIVAEAESFEAAKAFLERACALRSDDPAPHRAYALFLLGEDPQDDRLESLLATLGEIAPDDPVAVYGRGARLFDERIETEAEGERLLRVAIERLPDLEAPRLTLARGLVDRGRYAEALDLLGELGKDLEVQRERVRALLGQNKAQEAFELAEGHELDQSDKYGAMALKFTIAWHVRELEPALGFAETLSHVAGDHDDDSRLGYWEVEKLKCLLRLGRIDRAQTFGDKQIGEATDATYLAQVALGEEQVEVARHFAEHALTLDPEDAGAIGVMARVHELAGDTTLAEVEWRRAMELDAEEHAPRENLARLLAAKGEIDRASELADDALRLEPLCPWACSTRGMVRALRGDRDGARSDLERSWMLASPHDRDHGAETAWAVLASLRGDQEEAGKQVQAANVSKAPRSDVEKTLFAMVMKALA